MSIKTAQVSVSTTAAKLNTATFASPPGYTYDADGSSIAITAPAAAVLYIGGSDVTTANGFAVPAGSTVSIDLQAGEDVYGVLASGTGTASVLQTGL